MTLASYKQQTNPDSSIVRLTITSIDDDQMRAIKDFAEADGMFMTRSDDLGFGPNSEIDLGDRASGHYPLELKFRRPCFAVPIAIVADGVAMEVFMSFPDFVGEPDPDGADLWANFAVTETDYLMGEAAYECGITAAQVWEVENRRNYYSVFGTAGHVELYISCRNGYADAVGVFPKVTQPVR
jgi:hypothetical protein